MTGTITLLARDWILDVSTDGTNWIPLIGITDFSPTVTPNLVDTSDYDTDGWESAEPTMQAWKVGIKFNRKSTAGVKDPGQEILRACQGKSADAARAYLRWYRRQDGTEAKSGRALIEWAPDKTGNKDQESIAATATGDGVLSDIADVSVAATAPVVTAATPSGAAAGAQITITGSVFDGATGVKVGGVTAVYTIVSASTIVAIIPAGSAGSAPITVINAVGTSNALAYTRA